MEDLAKRVGARVKQLRTQQKLTHDQLSGTSGIPPETISRIERGRSGASLRSLERLAKGLGVEPSALLSSEAIERVSVETIPAEVRSIVLMLANKPPTFTAKVRKIIEVLLDEPEGSSQSTDQ